MPTLNAIFSDEEKRLLDDRTTAFILSWRVSRKKTFWHVASEVVSAARVDSWLAIADTRAGLRYGYRVHNPQEIRRVFSYLKRRPLRGDLRSLRIQGLVGQQVVHVALGETIRKTDPYLLNVEGWGQGWRDATDNEVMRVGQILREFYRLYGMTCTKPGLNFGYKLVIEPYGWYLERGTWILDKGGILKESAAT